MKSWLEQKEHLSTVIAATLIVLLGGLVYANSFQGQLLLDDNPSIIMNEKIRQDWSLWSVLSSSPRPLLYLTFAINYSLGGLKVFGYHVFNLAVHLIAGLALYGVFRRSFTSPLLASFPMPRAWALSIIATLFWLIHPLQVGSVTYVFQRAEAMMGMFYLLTIYSAGRFFAGGPYRTFWAAGAVAACFLGMTCKPVMVTAPLLVLIYDRIFWARSWARIEQERKKFYWALFSSWILLVWLVSNPQESLGSVGWGVEGMSSFRYALNQPSVILHYLRLVIWPHPLILDYSWPAADKIVNLLPAINGVGVLLAVTIWSVRRFPALGFLGFWFFLILIPSSSFIPLADLAFTHRLYLPLAGVIMLIVVGVDALLRRVFPNREERLLQGLIILVGVLGVFSYLTIQRNALFHNTVDLWTEEIRYRPDNARARYNLGLAYFEQGNKTEAMKYYLQAAALRPDYAKAHNNLGNLFYEQGDKVQAVAHYRAALALNPLYTEAHNNYGVILMEAGNFAEAEWHLKEVIRLNPGFTETVRNLGNLYYLSGDKKRAQEQYLLVLKSQPGNLYTRASLADIYAGEERFAEARRQYEEILLFQPNNPTVHNALGLILLKLQERPAAVYHFQEALRLDPQYAEARTHLLSALAAEKNTLDLRLRPVWPPPRLSPAKDPVFAPSVEPPSQSIYPASAPDKSPKKKRTKKETAMP